MAKPLQTLTNWEMALVHKMVFAIYILFVVHVQGSNFTKALDAIAVVHSFFAIENEGNLN
jgi:hypothetical protein